MAKNDILNVPPGFCSGSVIPPQLSWQPNPFWTWNYFVRMTPLLFRLYLCFALRRYLRIDCGGLKLCTFALFYVVICLRTVGKEEGLFTCRAKHVFACRMTFKFKFTARAVRSSTYVLFIPLQLSWQTTPFCSLRVAHDESFLVALVVHTDASRSQYPSRGVAFPVRYVLNMCSNWPDAFGLIHN